MNASDIADYPGLTPEQQKAYKANILKQMEMDAYAATPQGILTTYGQAAFDANVATGAITPTQVTGLAQKITSAGQTVQQFIEDNKVPIAIGATAVGLAGLAAGATAIVRSRSGKSRKAPNRRSSGSGRTKSSGSRKGRKLKFGSPAWRKKYMKKGGKRKGQRNRKGGAVKDKYKGHKVLLTKKGQPYIILANGKARFVKK